MRRYVPDKQPVEWSDEWSAGDSFDQLWSTSGGYEIRRSRHVLGVEISAGRLGQRVYVARGFELPRCELVCLYVGFDLPRAKRHCELHRQRQLAAKRRGFRRERQQLRRTRRRAFRLN